MDLEAARRAAAGHGAAVVIAALDEATGLLRDVDGRARVGIVEAAHVDRIAPGVGQRPGVDVDHLACRIHGRAIARRAHGHGDVVAGPRRALGARRAVERAANQRREDRVVVERLAGFVLERTPGLEPGRVHLGGQGQAQVTRHQSWILRIGRQIAGSVADDELLDLPHRLAFDRFQPRSLGLGRCDTGQLAHGRKRHRTARERVADHGQGRERLGDTDALARGPRPVAEQARRYSRNEP
jgi:hypothetical protein